MAETFLVRMKPYDKRRQPHRVRIYAGMRFTPEAGWFNVHPLRFIKKNKTGAGIFSNFAGFRLGQASVFIFEPYHFGNGAGFTGHSFLPFL